MKLEQSVVDGVGKLLLDHQFWSDCKMFVADVDGKTELTGEQKRAKVRADLRFIFGDVASIFLAIGIELALGWVKANGTQSK